MTHPVCSCGNKLKPTNLRFKPAHFFDPDDLSDDVYMLQDLFCDNPKCDNFCGNPVTKTVDTMKTKV